MLRHQRNYRKVFLLIGSYCFYGAWDWRFTLLLFQCSIFNYGFGRWLENATEQGRKRIVTLAVISNWLPWVLQILRFFLDVLQRHTHCHRTRKDIHILEIVLPRHFFLYLQGMSYVIDVYRRELEFLRTQLMFCSTFHFFHSLSPTNCSSENLFRPTPRAPRPKPGPYCLRDSFNPCRSIQEGCRCQLSSHHVGG